MMSDAEHPDWDPRSELSLGDPFAVCDEMRRRCPVAYSGDLGWSLFRHDDVIRVLSDHETFSNRVSKRRSVPNGMDPPEHTAYRQAIEPYFAAERMSAFESVCRELAAALLEPLATGEVFDGVEAFAIPYALRCQFAFLGWPDTLAQPLRQWIQRSQQATLAADREALEELAAEFRSYVDRLLDERRRATGDALQDITTELMRTRVNGSTLSDHELTSVLRNWTVGEVGSLASAIGIVLNELCVNGALQRRLRAEPSLLPGALDEVLRVWGPLVLNRRRATRDVEIGGRRIAAGDLLSLIWISANRDEAVFERPGEVQFGREPHGNLLYGAGIHVCPGAPLARLEMRIAIEEVFRRCERVELSPAAAPRRAVYPAMGWASLPVRLA